MQDTERFDNIYDLLAENEEIELDVREDIRDHLDMLQQRLIELRKFVYKCLTDGWTDTDLALIRLWITDQGDQNRHDTTAIAAIDALFAGAPTTLEPTQQQVANGPGVAGGQWIYEPMPIRHDALTARITGAGIPDPRQR